MTAFLTRRIRLAVPLFVLALAAAAPSHAAGFSGVERFWSWLLRWVPATGASDIGPIIDPNGGQGTGSGTTQGDIGPDIDPWGGKGAASGTTQGDIGPMIDPNGGKG